MVRMSQNSKGLPANPGGLHSIFMALVLSIVLGSSVQIPPVQAAPDNPADVYFEVSASCAGYLLIRQPFEKFKQGFH